MPLKLIAKDATQPTGQVRPNLGFEAEYRRRLIAMVSAMQADVLKEVHRVYSENPPEVAQDESPAMAMRNLMASLNRKWQKRFNEGAVELGKWFAKGVTERSDVALKSILNRAGFTIDFKLTPALNDVVQATVGQNVALIKSIPQQHLNEVEGIVLRSVQAGRDLYTVSNELHKRYEVTTRRAAFIAKDQNNKATAQISRTRQMGAGIVENIWRHNPNNHPRTQTHVPFDGHKFPLATGHDFKDGLGFVWPGTAFGCHCTGSPVIPGLS